MVTVTVIAYVTVTFHDTAMGSVCLESPLPGSMRGLCVLNLRHRHRHLLHLHLHLHHLHLHSSSSLAEAIWDRGKAAVATHRGQLLDAALLLHTGHSAMFN